ncbi:MAG TPA: DUF6090 family protein [Yeosuana sp.]
MIPFFRKIRKTLADDKKPIKYMRYAIGEIVLVVIGILIALSINNWNEHRKLKIDERELLTNLSIEFNRKLDELEGKNQGRIENIKGIDQLLQIISKRDSIINDEEIIKIIGGLQTMYEVNEEFSIIELLFSSGKINTISNGSLKANLISWPDKLEEMFEEQRTVKDIVVHQLNPLINTYVSQAYINNKYWSFRGVKNIVESPFENDFEVLFSDRRFESLIASKRSLLRANIRDTKILIEAAKSILEMIKKELKP